MRNLMLATASAIVLGMAGAGIGHAAELYSSPTNTPGSAMQTPSAMTASEILIRAAQQQLKYSGLYDGSVDGKMGSETQRALRQFQQLLVNAAQQFLQLSKGTGKAVNQFRGHL